MARRTELRKRMNGSISYQMTKSSSPSARVTRIPMTHLRKRFYPLDGTRKRRLTWMTPTTLHC